MDNLPKNILNYFATFTETRFNFRKLINYRWTNDELTLDLSLFSDFQKSFFGKIKTGKLQKITVKKGQYTISVPQEELYSGIEKQLSQKFNLEYLQSCVAQAKEKNRERDSKLIATNDGIIEKSTNNKENEAPSRAVFLEGIRTYNLALRKFLEEILLEVQDNKLNKIKEDCQVEYLPPTIFNPHAYTQEYFDSLQQITKKSNDEKDYYDNVQQYFKKETKEIVVYDLFFNLQKYTAFTNIGTQYLFINELFKELDDKNAVSYPLYFIEVEINPTPSEVEISIPRKLLLINSPAINYFQFPSVLTTTRAVDIGSAQQQLSQVEVFLQTQYGYKDPFITESIFKPIIPPKEEYPTIRSRFGIQIVKNEDKRLLDYSELLTRSQLGEKSNFADFVSRYLEGNVENNQDSVDREFYDKYPINSPKRYVSDNPLPLNDAQKRIVLALKNNKNKIIVVDGPPGTGKSHTIAAISYWANQNKRSVVITSHKKAALDVIDDMLTSKFQKLHPKIKPSIIRFDPNGQNLNNLTNTLQSSVINAANDRSMEFNQQAVLEDSKNFEKELENKIEEKFTTIKNTQYLKMLLDFEILGKSLIANKIIDEEDLTLTKIDSKININFDLVEDLYKKENFVIPDINLDQYELLLRNKSLLPEFLNSCDKLQEISEEVSDFDIEIKELPKDFIDLVYSSCKIFNEESFVLKLTQKDVIGGLLRTITGRVPKKERVEKTVSSFKSLKYSHILEEIARMKGVKKDELTLSQIKEGLDILQALLPLREYKKMLVDFKRLSINKSIQIQDIYKTILQFQESSHILTDELYKSLITISQYYNQIFESAGIEFEELSTITEMVSNTSSYKNLWQWIKLHYQLSQVKQTESLEHEKLNSYYEIRQKEVEHLNDLRLKNLNNFIGDIARIKESFIGGKRFSDEQTKVLLENIPCIIAEPNLISKYFPMSEDSIDILVIDEASQVSIADSISLILRAKQVVIFGDEYQYGAVGAVNVSSKYSAGYFKEILNAYSEDYKTVVSPEQEKELINEVSKEITDEADQEVQEVLVPKDIEGKILWLKTFDIRTSTLSFAKAIANYSTSLRVHFRSFPEIIDYSNEYFYKKAQMELIVNRIRTKPIAEVLKFIKVETKGSSGPNTNLDEIEAIITDLKERLKNGFTGTVGIITSFREQQAKMVQILAEEFNLTELKKKHNLEIWFVGDVQGIERDLVYYSFVEDNKFPETSLTNIYPVIGGNADTIRSLKMQRLNVGFSRAKDTMVFIHSMPLEKYANTRLGDSLKHYKKLFDINLKNDYFIEDESILESEAEKKLYTLLLQTEFIKSHRDNIRIIPQFQIGDYIRTEFKKQIPKYRVDFLVTYSKGGKEQTLILEYDGVEFHTKNPEIVTKHNFSQEFLDYDIARQLELETYGYRFLRINKFSLVPEQKGEQEKDVLNRLIEKSFIIEE